jgi:hypothetical protein
MPYRILANGVIETDSLAEALEVQNALTGKRNHHRGQSRKTSNAKDILGLNAKAFLRELIKAPQTGVTTEHAARAIGVEPRGIPPIIRSINNYCKRHRVVMTDLVERRDGYENKRQVSIYKFTDAGRTYFAKYVSEPSENGVVPHKEE